MRRPDECGELTQKRQFTVHNAQVGLSFLFRLFFNLLDFPCVLLYIAAEEMSCLVVSRSRALRRSRQTVHLFF